MDSAIADVSDKNYAKAAIQFDKFSQLANDPDVGVRARAVSSALRKLEETRSDGDIQLLLIALDDLKKSLTPQPSLILSTPPVHPRYFLTAPITVTIPYGTTTVAAKTEVRLIQQTKTGYRVQSGNLDFEVPTNQLLSSPQ